MSFSFNNINHSVRLYGFENTASPVVWLLHGAGGDQSHYDTVLAPLLEKKCRIIVSDVRLHGRSQPIDKDVPCDLTADTVVKDMFYILNQLVDKYGGFKLYMAGFSMGGLIFQLFARSYRKTPIESVDLAGIILIASCVIGLTWERIGWMNTYYDDAETDQTTIDVKEGLVKHPINQYGKEASKRAADMVESLDNLSKIFRFCSKVLTPMEDAPEFTSTLDIPMVLITPENDLYTKGELLYLHEHNKKNDIQSEVVEIKDAGHMVILEQGPAVGQAIARLFE